jgi:hypothetical protein
MDTSLPPDDFLPSPGDAPAHSRHLPDEIVIAERQEIARRRTTYGLEAPDPQHTPASGLALSGGGIRSATFCLGVVQALAEADQLKRFDYLSTVSGGGYLGASLLWWASGGASEPGKGTTFGLAPWHHPDPGLRFPYVSPDQLPMDQAGASPGTEPPSPFARLDHLRRHGRYLTPGRGITLMSLFSAVVRGAFLQLAFWLPLLALLLLGLITLLNGRPEASPGLATPLLWDVLWRGGLLGLGLCVAGLLYWWLTRHGPDHPPSGVERALERPRPVSILAVLALMTGLAVWLAASSPAWQGLVALLGVAGMMLVAFGLLALLYGLLSGCLVMIERHWGDGRSQGFLHLMGYDMRRLWDTWAGLGALLTIALALIGSLPLLSWSGVVGLLVAGPSASGIGALLGGTALASFAFSRSQQQFHESEPERQPWRSAILASGLLLAGVLLLAHEFAMLLLQRVAPASPWALLLLLAGLLLFGMLCHPNHISVHRYYRDRLMEAYMPGVRQTEAAVGGPAPNAADTLSLSACREALARVPFPLINTNLVLVNARNARRRDIGGDNFVLSPLFCGSTVTGWRATDRYPASRLTLATAMAISGAAANPNTGFGGVGKTRSRPVALAMALLNVRLGYWLPHPDPGQATRWPLPASQLWPGLCAFLPCGHHEAARFQELSDGGHFENLGLFELLRRRTRLVVAVDGSQDEGSRFASLQLALSRCRELLGVQIVFDHCYETQRGTYPADQGGGPLDPLIPRHPVAYPAGACLARHAHLIGRIHYPAGGGYPAQRGTLILVKSALIPGLPLRLMGYRDRSPSFPNEPTRNQFFTEEQFEAYRELGVTIGRALLADPETGLAGRLNELVPDGRPR